MAVSAANTDELQTYLENIQHDMRTSLIAISDLSLLIQKEAISPLVKEYAEHLVRASKALLDFQTDLLTHTPSNVTDLIHTQKLFSLDALCEKVINLIRPRAILKNIVIHVNYPKSKLPYFKGCAHLLFRILLELLTNALKFTEKGRIDLYIETNEMSHQSMMLHFKIADTGIGIPNDQLKTIFNRGFYLDNSESNTGLGLSNVTQWIKSVNGTMDVESEVNKGSIFSCAIPMLIAENLPKENFSFNETDQFPHCHILLIEDHPVTALATKALLSDLQCKITTAHTAKDALLLIENTFFDLALIDLNLPDMHGFALAEKISDKNLTIIGLTASMSIENTSKYIQEILPKPLTKPITIQLLNRLFRDKHERKDN